MSTTHPRSKVARLLDEYGLEHLGDELAKRWTRSENRQGIRQLADYFNQRLLEAAMQDLETSPLEGEIENTYRLLTDAKVSSGVRAQTRNQLANAGVDVEGLEGDFVSKQAIHTYLTKYRDLEPPEDTTSAEEVRAQKTETVERLQQRLRTVSERVLRTLKRADRLTLGEFRVIVNVRVHCSDCGTQLPIARLLDAGACQCPSEPT